MVPPVICAAMALSAEIAPRASQGIVDDDPAPPRVWLPAFAQAVGAPPPPGVSEAEAAVAFGLDPVYYATRPRGAANDKAKRELQFRPRPLEWLSRA
jgi:2-alkyl-3-oxoalkanoate reductase